jgi:CHAD domain-containing protein
VAATPILKHSPDTSPKPAKPKLGLRAWMERVLEECDRADRNFDADAVHDLRVGLRRCRSLADGLIALDPDSSWKDMKKAGKKVFQALGDLRDMQVMEEWIDKLSDKLSHMSSAKFSDKPSDKWSETRDPSNDPVAVRLLDHIHAREAVCKQLARKDLDQFDRKQWRQWSKTLPQRAARVRPGSVVYLHLALEKWTEAYELHKRALRTRSTVGWHQLRIGIKHFRYTVENFLPAQHAQWGDDLKELQDLLGEVHDLDVLWATAIDSNVNAFPDLQSRKEWREKLNLERQKRLARYREKMVGRHSLWRLWRADLPSGPQLHAAAMSRLRTWAGYLDPDFAHAQRVAQLSLHLYDGLKNAGLILPNHISSNSVAPNARSRTVDADADSDLDPRAILQAAAFMHEVGQARGQKNHQKKSYRMIRSMTRPLGWSARELELAATVARYHRGALPRPRGKIMQRLDLPDRPMATMLAAILRLSAALDLRKRRNSKRSASRDAARSRADQAAAKRVEVRLQDNFVIVRAEGYSPLDRSAERIAAARHLLEAVLRRPVLVRPLRTSATRVRSAVRRPASTSNGASNLAKRLEKSNGQATESRAHKAA